MQIVQVDPSNRRQVRLFIDLPFCIYKDFPQWVPPFKMDMRAALDVKRYPFYKHSEAAFFLAQDGDGEPMGRIAAINNRRYNDYNKERAAFFYWFECVQDPVIAKGLFEAAFAWARRRGLEKMVGPRGFTPLDGGGMLVRGYEHRPAFGMPYNPPYYQKMVEEAGFDLHHETVSGYLGTSLQFPPRIHELSERIQQRRGLHIARYRNRRDLRLLIPHLGDLYNDSLVGTRENVPLTREEVAALANQLLWFADPRLVKIVMKGDKPVGFLFGYPDISAALQRTKGEAFPFGWIDLLRELRCTDWLNLNGAGLVEEYRGLGGTAILFSEMFKTVVETGQYRHAEVVQMGIENENMQREMRNFGIDFYKTHRVYIRRL